jgi:hypothetical protein
MIPATQEVEIPSLRPAQKKVAEKLSQKQNKHKRAGSTAPVIRVLAKHEQERLWVKSPQQFKKKKKKKAWGLVVYGSVLEHVLITHRALNSIPPHQREMVRTTKTCEIYYFLCF